MNALELADGRLAALRSEAGTTRVLALHGWLDNAYSFLPLADHLDDCDLVALDFPGHGLSARRPEGVRYYFDEYVFDVLAALDELGWDEAHLLGHSLGGAVATLVAAATPERIRSLALIEGLGPLSAPAEKTAAGWQQTVKRSYLRPRRNHADFDSGVAARAHGSDLDPSAAELLGRRGLVQADGGWQWRHDLRLTWPSPHRYTEAQVIDLLSAIRAPVLNVYSDPPSGIIERRILHLRLAALRQRSALACPGGHHLHMRHPDRIGPAIKEHFHRHD